MLPMISNVKEVTDAQLLIRARSTKSSKKGISGHDAGHRRDGRSAGGGVSGAAAREAVDFLAVGSNDLTQYMLAVDRNNPRVASLYRDLHPAVLQALRDVAIAGHS